MKQYLLVLFLMITTLVVKAQNTDLPTPGSNLVTLPAGSYVIPMDNTLQTNSTIGSGSFNLNAYGLIVYLLHNNVKVKWVIKAGKSKDGIDFTGTAEGILPGAIAAASRDFIAGPFVIFSSDTTNVAALVNNFYTLNALTGNNRPRVFRLTAPVANVDIRYDLAGFKPKAAILTDGGNQAIHLGYMTACKIPSFAYSISTGTDLLIRCFTFASEPHNNKTGATVNATINTIKSFVNNGGNFLAQCAAVENYENNANGRFQTTNGITVNNANLGTSLSYPNPDLSFSQFQGTFSASLSGSVKTWTMSTPKNNQHDHAHGTGANSSSVVASVSKVKSGNGGLVFYIGNHEFKLSDGMPAINGIRMYMNAFLTPNTINRNCNTGEPLSSPLPVKLSAFNASLQKEQNKVLLTWTTQQEINVSHFIIERSTDGVTYSDAGMVFAYGNTNDTKNYSLYDNIANLQATVIYYRLRSVDIDGKNELSNVRIIRIGKGTENNISILTYPNPVSNVLRITVPANWQNKRAVYEIFNANGQIARRVETAGSSQTETINVSGLAPGFYIVRVNCNGETAQQRIVKQ